MIDLIDALFAGIASILAQPAAAAIIASIVGIVGSLIISNRSEARSTRRAHSDYLHRRHDHFEDSLADLAAVIDEWASEEVSLLNTYGHSKPDSEDDAALERTNKLRQQITNQLNQLRARAPHDDASLSTSALHRALKSVEDTWSGTRTARAYMEHAIGPWALEDEEVQSALIDGRQAVARVEETVQELFTANAAHVEALR